MSPAVSAASNLSRKTWTCALLVVSSIMSSRDVFDFSAIIAILAELSTESRLALAPPSPSRTCASIPEALRLGTAVSGILDRPVIPDQVGDRRRATTTQRALFEN